MDVTRNAADSTAGTCRNPPLCAGSKDKGVTTLFLVLLLALKSQSKQGTNVAMCCQSLKLLVCLLKNTVGNSEGSYDVFDFVFNTHFTRLGIPFAPTHLLTTNELAQKACAELGIYYPHELEGGFNSPKCVMPTVDVFMVMCRLGLVPFQVLLSLSALLDDAISLGRKVTLYEAPVRALVPKRQKVGREEKALAYFAFLNDVRKGVKASMKRPLEPPPKVMVYNNQNPPGADLASSNTKRGATELHSQTCKDFAATTDGYEYKNVLNLGASIL